MNAATISALSAAIVAVVTAVGNVLLSLHTRSQLAAHVAAPVVAHPTIAPPSQVSPPNSHA